MDYSGFDFKTPDYTLVFKQRAEFLARLRAEPHRWGELKSHYRNAPWDLINDWGMTYDPREMDDGGLTNVPFVLWPKQREFLIWLTHRWQGKERGLVEKCRDGGVTWLCVGWAVSQWCTRDGFSAGFGSRKKELVDKLGDSKCIFEKIRHFINFLPPELLPDGFSMAVNSKECAILSPNTGASIIGEGGDDIGRGGRNSIYFVDEKAFIQHQDSVDRALSQTTNCQIDVSTFNGNGNKYYKDWLRFRSTRQHFVFDWRDDPRKDQAWYDKMCREHDEVTVAQEIDRDPNASAENTFIPAKWVAACIDAHVTLGFQPSGLRKTGFDVADIGDARAVVNQYGSVVTEAKAITEGDITYAIPVAYELADQHRSDVFSYDADGMGAPTMKLALQHVNPGRMRVVPYYGSGAVEDPEGIYAGDKDTLVKTNADTFKNFRAQSWTWLRDRIHKTYLAVKAAREGKIVNADPDELYSISTECEHWQDLQSELSRPQRVYGAGGAGKIQVESKRDMLRRGVDSPNLADAAVIANAARMAEQKKRATRKTVYRPPVIRDRTIGF